MSTRAMPPRELLDGLDPETVVALLHEIFAASSEAVGLSRLDLIKMANPALAALLGYESPDELVGRSVLDLVAPGSREVVMEILRRRFAGEKVPPSFPVQLVRRDGTKLSAAISGVSFQLEGEAHSLTVVRAVSDPELSRSPAPSEELYRAMFEVNTAVKLLIAPATGEIVDANPAAVEFYGWPLEKLRTMRITDINQLTSDEVKAEMEKARTGKRRYFRFRHRTASGDIRHVEVHSGPIMVDGEQLLFSIIHDVTERDQLQDQLHRAQRLEAIGRLAGGIAHDFNNLLTVMLTTAGAMRRRVEDESPLRPYVDDLGHATQRAAELTRSLLAFSRRQVMRPQPLQLNQVVHEMEGLLRRTLGAAIDLRVELAPNLPVVEADPARIDQVIMNLAINARDAMPSGGRLTLRTSATVVDEAAVTAVPPGRWVTLTVEDTGTGMDETTRSRVFEPFFTTKAAGRGTGLGLSTAYGIVSQSSGHLTVTSEPGRGSRFVVLLPPAASQTASPPARSTTAAPAARPQTVLLVDDIEQVRMALGASLEAAGMRVIYASSAEQALEICSSGLDDIDVVVTDVVMPGRSGVELALTLRERRPDLPLVLMSGDVRDHDQARLPGAHWMQKPFSGEELLRLLERLDE